MKACQFGTATEQQLFRIGYLTAKQRPQCGNCKHFDSVFINPDAINESERCRCKKGSFAISKTAICIWWEAK